MLKHFKTFNLAVQFHDHCTHAKVPYYLRDQLLRASSSVALNIGEGYGKLTPKDKRKYYSIALGSLRECEAALCLAHCSDDVMSTIMDQLGACLYRLCHPKN